MSTVRITQKVTNDIYDVALRYFGAIRSTVYPYHYPEATQVASIVGRHGTLLQALKFWPPLWELVPKHIKVRHGSTSVPPYPPIEGMREDLRQLTIALLTAKLRGAQPT